MATGALSGVMAFTSESPLPCCSEYTMSLPSGDQTDYKKACRAAELPPSTRILTGGSLVPIGATATHLPSGTRMRRRHRGVRQRPDVRAVGVHDTGPRDLVCVKAIWRPSGELRRHHAAIVPSPEFPGSAVLSFQSPRTAFDERKAVVSGEPGPRARSWERHPLVAASVSMPFERGPSRLAVGWRWT
jgi:hypothetical protein